MVEILLGEMIRSGDVKGIFDLFNKAGNWDTRETAVVALRNMVWDRSNIEYNKDEMVKALKQIIEVCEFETSGGTYRTNCIDMAKGLLKEIEG